MEHVVDAAIFTTPEQLWDFLLDKLVKEESYEKLNICKQASAGRWLGKKIIVNKQMSKERFTHCALVKYWQYYGISVNCKLCSSASCKDFV